MWSIQNAAILFVLAALGGVTMLVIRLRGANPADVACDRSRTHCLVRLRNSRTRPHHRGFTGARPIGGWRFFMLAVAGGMFLFLGYQVRGKLLPVPVIFVHGLIAATGLVLLLKVVFSF